VFRSGNEVALLVKGEVVEYGKVVRDHFFLLNRLGVALDVAVLVKNVTILIDSIAHKALGITLDNLANYVVVLISDLAVLDDTETLKTSEGAFRLSLSLLRRNKFDAANDLARIVPDLALVVELTASKLLRVAFDKTCDRHTFAADDIALLVDSETFEGR